MTDPFMQLKTKWYAAMWQAPDLTLFSPHVLLLRHPSPPRHALLEVHGFHTRMNLSNANLIAKVSLRVVISVQLGAAAMRVSAMEGIARSLFYLLIHHRMETHLWWTPAARKRLLAVQVQQLSSMHTGKSACCTSQEDLASLCPR